MKKLLLVLLLALALSLAACGTDEATDAPPTEPAADVVEPTEDLPDEMEPVELRFTYYADGVEADVMQPILDAFMAEHPEITVVLDVVPYATIDEQLPVLVESGEGPDS